MHGNMEQGKRNKKQKERTIYDHINYKYHIDIETEIHTERQWRSYSVNKTGNNNNNNNNNITKSKETWPASKNIYTNAKICNSWHMFNCKKLSKL
jgi:hypothetical protein